MVNREIKRAIEACRPGSDDVSLPEMSPLAESVDSDPSVRELFERSQQCDRAIRRVFQNVPVPDGLSDRLLAALEQQDLQDSPRLPEDRRGQPLGSPSADPTRGPRSRRRWLGIAVGLAAALSLSVLGVLFFSNSGVGEPVANERLRQDISVWRNEMIRKGWRENGADPQLAQRPMDGALHAAPRRWCVIDTRYDRTTVVYDLAGPGDRFAYLFCMRIPEGDSVLPNIPPVKPYAPTGRVCIGTWRRGNVVYVLAVDGGPARYRQFLGRSILLG